MPNIRRFFKFFLLFPNYHQRSFGLDLLRAIAILIVVLNHGGWMLEKADSNFPWIRLINGVELFFVLSGFLIGGILINTIQTTKKLTFRTLRNFWIRRWFRTLPNYYLILGLNILVVFSGIIKEDISQFNWKFFLFLQNFSKPFYGFFWESWSISIEEWFYLLFPILFCSIFVCFKKHRMSILLFSITLFLIVSLLLRWGIASKFVVDDFWLGVKIEKVVIFHFDGIAFGLFAAFIKQYKPNFWMNYRIWCFMFGIIISYSLLYTSWLPNDFSTKVYKLFFQSFGCSLLLPFFDGIKKAPMFITKIITHLSLISYSMYLINLALVSEIIRSNFPPNGKFTAWITYIFYWLAVIVCATFIYKYFEKPIMDIRDKIKN